MSGTERVPCVRCGAMILPITAQSNQGLCGKCHREDIWAEQDRLRAAAAPGHPAEPPNIRIDEGFYDECQLQLVREIVRTIKQDLENSSVTQKELAEVTGNIAFSVAAIIDGSRVMKVKNRVLAPVLTFAENDERTQLVGRAGSSFMHELVESTLDEVFDEEEV